jgi:hypothetical protein
MFYAIDYDTRTVESKSKNGKDLYDYVSGNKLELAVAVVDSEDELCLSFSLDEMEELFYWLTGTERAFDTEEKAAQVCWKYLDSNQDGFPNFTKALGKRLLKGAAKRNSDKTNKKFNEQIKVSNTSAPRSKVKLDGNDTICVVNGKCKKGSILSTIVTAIEDELCDTVDEIHEYILDNYVPRGTTESPDIKSTIRNIKLLIKKGSLSLGEKL